MSFQSAPNFAQLGTAMVRRDAREPAAPNPRQVHNGRLAPAALAFREIFRPFVSKLRLARWSKRGMRALDSLVWPFHLALQIDLGLRSATPKLYAVFALCLPSRSAGSVALTVMNCSQSGRN